MIEKRFDMLNEQKKEDSIPPIQPEPVVQTLEIVNIEHVKLEDNTGLSSVQKRESKDNNAVNETQSNNIIETDNQINPVSINSEPMLQFTGNESSHQKVKNLRQQRLKLKRMNRMKAMKKNEEMESIEETDKDDDSSSTVKFLVKHTFNFLITIITGFFNLMQSNKDSLGDPSSIGTQLYLGTCITSSSKRCHRTNLPGKSIDIGN